MAKQPIRDGEAILINTDALSQYLRTNDNGDHRQGRPATQAQRGRAQVHRPVYADRRWGLPSGVLGL